MRKIKIRNNGGLVLLIVFLSFWLCRSIVIDNLIKYYGDTTVGHVYKTGQTGRHGITINKYYYTVNGKEYKSRTECECNSILEVRYLKICPRLHFVQRDNDKK